MLGDWVALGLMVVGVLTLAFTVFGIGIVVALVLRELSIACGWRKP